MILNEIVARTKQLVEQRKALTPLAEIKLAAINNRPPRDFAEALKRNGMSLIAEIKRASPSKGTLCPDLNAPSLASTYQNSGAAAISVLTEPEYFKGSLEDLDSVRSNVDIPVLRKDFIFDQYQVYEARAHSADAVLLIAAILTRNELKNLLNITHSLGMVAVVEVHNQDELMTVWNLSPRIIGINNRNLADFTVDIETTLNLRLMVPSDTVVVSESGIHTRNDVLKLQMAGVDAILVGEALVTNNNPSEKIRELLGSTE